MTWIQEFVHGLPPTHGSPIVLDFLPELSAACGKLLSGAPERGRPVHAASFLRERRIVLESCLLEQNENLRLILTHELFHFAWIRLSNEKRAGFASILLRECDANARGELGESADVAKAACATHERAWRNYVGESFCDTAASLYAGVGSHPSFRLAQRWWKPRRQWFAQFEIFRV